MATAELTEEISVLKYERPNYDPVFYTSINKYLFAILVEEKAKRKLEKEGPINLDKIDISIVLEKKRNTKKPFLLYPIIGGIKIVDYWFVRSFVDNQQFLFLYTKHSGIKIYSATWGSREFMIPPLKVFSKLD